MGPGYPYRSANRRGVSRWRRRRFGHVGLMIGDTGLRAVDTRPGGASQTLRVLRNHEHDA